MKMRAWCAAMLAAVSALPSAARAQDAEPGGPKVEAEAPPKKSEVRPFRLGLSQQFWLGIGGQLDNPRPQYNLTADFAFPTGRAMRYHFEIAYANLNAHSGIRACPLIFGYEIPIEQSFLPPELSLEVEVMLSLVQADVLFGPEYAISLSSGLRSQVLLSWGQFFAALTFLGFEVRYAYGVQEVGVRTGVGVNWPIHLSLGVEL